MIDIWRTRVRRTLRPSLVEDVRRQVDDCALLLPAEIRDKFGLPTARRWPTPGVALRRVMLSTATGTMAVATARRHVVGASEVCRVALRPGLELNARQIISRSHRAWATHGFPFAAGFSGMAVVPARIFDLGDIQPLTFSVAAQSGVFSFRDSGRRWRTATQRSPGAVGVWTHVAVTIAAARQALRQRRPVATNIPCPSPRRCGTKFISSARAGSPPTRVQWPLHDFRCVSPRWRTRKLPPSTARRASIPAHDALQAALRWLNRITRACGDAMGTGPLTSQMDACMADRRREWGPPDARRDQRGRDSFLCRHRHERLAEHGRRCSLWCLQ